MSSRAEKLMLLPPMLLAAATFLLGINWGLPSRSADAYLFGNHPVWSGNQIVSLLNSGEPASAGGGLTIGADVDPNAFSRRLRPLIVNATDSERAEIVTRYRLYSYQPDEMITFRALSTISKTRGDPRLYQYGGLWIYPVGVLLKIGSWLHLIDLRADVAFYLDHPEAFARFYLAARLYVFAWALVGVWAIFWLAHKLTQDRIVAMLAACGYALMPVVINMAHEAKPHLPGAVLMLLALIAATRYIETASRRWALVAGALWGAAFAMVLTGALAFILLPAMCWMRWRARPPLAPSRWRAVLADLFLASLLGAAVYCVSNPFVVIHLLRDHELLASNLGNSQAMYHAALQPDALLHAAQLISAGASPVFAIAGALAILLAPRRQHPVRALSLIVSLPVLAQFTILATDKPAEYARFAIFIDIALMLLAFGSIAAIFKKPLVRNSLLAGMCSATGVWGTGYVWHFLRDSIDRTPRLIAAERLRQIEQNGASEIAIYSDPAPYCLPPIDLFHWRLMLTDPGAAPPPTSDLLIHPTDEIPNTDVPMIGFEIQYWIRPRLLATPISWAAKPFRVLLRREYAGKPEDGG